MMGRRLPGELDGREGTVPDVDQVSAFLAARGVPVLRFEEATPTAPAAARAVGCSVGEIAKTLLFLVGGAPVAVIAAGDVKVAGGKLKRTLGRTGKVRLPTAEEVHRHTGYSPGGVCPFLLPPRLPLLLDVSLRRFPTVYPAAGDDHTAVPVSVDRLVALTGAREVDVCRPPPAGGTPP
ncbi:MAG: YbaK/EbsC family protein [Deferrisomatales bacterium]